MSTEPTQKKARWVRKASSITVALFVLYVGSYAVFSATGGWVVSMSGELRSSLTYLATYDIFVWQPRYGDCRFFRFVDGRHGLNGDELGKFYAPLILFDQAYIHRTIRFITLDGHPIEPIPAPPFSEYHPLRMDRFYKRFPYKVQSDAAGG